MALLEWRKLPHSSQVGSFLERRKIRFLVTLHGLPIPTARFTAGYSDPGQRLRVPYLRVLHMRGTNTS